MSVAPTSGPIKKALKAKMRANTTINTAAVGGIVEGINTRKSVKFPYISYSVAYLPLERSWGSTMLIAAFDIVVRGEDPEGVSSLFEAITKELDDSKLFVTGLSTLIVELVEELPLQPEQTAEGKKVHQNGGTFSVWVNKDHSHD